MIQTAIEKTAAGRHLSETEMMSTLETIADGRASDAQIGALLIALRIKGETEDEITGAARVLRARSTSIPFVRSGDGGATDPGEIIIDTCGTGGDGIGSFNISTTTAFVVAGAGLKVAKHGNRSVSSQCGSADVLEALGVDLSLSPDQVGACIDRIGLGFLFAPLLHSAMKHVVGPRRELGLRTMFNILGPLTNPARANVQVLGVYRPELTETMARVLRRLGCRAGFVVHGEDGSDEISISGPTRMTRINGDEITSFRFFPASAGLDQAGPEAIRGGDAATNAAITRAVLSGEQGPCRDVILLNAAAVFVAAGLAEDFKAGATLAGQVIDSGRALDKLEALIAFSQEAVAPKRAAG